MFSCNRTLSPLCHDEVLLKSRLTLLLVLMQVLEIAIRDSRMTGRAAVGVVRVPLRQLPTGAQRDMWLPVQPSASGAKVCLPTHTNCFVV